MRITNIEDADAPRLRLAGVQYASFQSHAFKLRCRSTLGSPTWLQHICTDLRKFASRFASRFVCSQFEIDEIKFGQIWAHLGHILRQIWRQIWANLSKSGAETWARRQIWGKSEMHGVDHFLIEIVEDFSQNASTCTLRRWSPNIILIRRRGVHGRGVGGFSRILVARSF